MGRFDTIKTTIDANIKENGSQEITGQKMNSVLTEMVNATDAELTELESELVEEQGAERITQELIVSSLPQFFANLYHREIYISNIANAASIQGNTITIIEQHGAERLRFSSMVLEKGASFKAVMEETDNLYLYFAENKVLSAGSITMSIAWDKTLRDSDVAESLEDSAKLTGLSISKELAARIETNRKNISSLDLRLIAEEQDANLTFKGKIFNSDGITPKLIVNTNLLTTGSALSIRLLSSNDEEISLSVYGYDGEYKSLGTIRSYEEFNVTLAKDYEFLQLYNNKGNSIYSVEISINNVKKIYERIAAIEDVNDNQSMQIQKLESLRKKLIVVDINGNGDYTSLNDAIANAGDSSSNPKTILVLPGRYEMPIANSDNRNSFNFRHLSIIGTDKQNCIVFNKNGNYISGSANYTDSSPIKIGGNVYIANLTIIATDEEYVQEDNNQKRSYCVHFDFGMNDGDICEVHNCRLYNNHFSAVGIGAQKNGTIKVTNCEIDVVNTFNQWGGAIYAHNNQVTSEGCKFVFADNIIRSNVRPFRIDDAYSNGNSVDIDFIRNVSAASQASYIAESMIINSISFGNSESLLNKNS